jgi:hypothetical protein
MTRWRSTMIWAAVLAVALGPLAGCARPNRTATLNQVTETPGSQVAKTLEQELARQGFPAAKVSCAHTLVINVGLTTSCAVSGAGASHRTTFTFRTSSGQIALASVKAS